jgi:4-amino-4-deoxy-L-arabinose transferase-like glycosyltransferase
MTKKNKLRLALGVVLLLHLALRIPGLSQPYHQDEYKWAQIVAVGSPTAGTIPHPPLSELIYTITDRVFGNGHLRMMPFLFSILNLGLIFLVARKRYGDKTALIAAGLFSVSFYSILASLMVDTDGQILPCLFLLGLLAYDRFLDSQERKYKWSWFSLFIAAMALGMLTKLSFIIPVAVFVLDAAYRERKRINKKVLAYGLGAAAGLAVVCLLLLLNAHYVFPKFNFSWFFSYTQRFFILGGRNWFQTLIQLLKSLMYASPLLLALLCLASREILAKTRIFWLHLGATFMFYIVLFDFSVGALDRYLQAFVIPLCMISAVVVNEFLFSAGGRLKRWHMAVTVGSALVLFSLQFLPHVVPPQHPKAEWLSRLASLKWNFLFPFSGGSGPLGFYVSFLFVAACFIACWTMAVGAFFRPVWRKPLALGIVAVGLVYNFTFTEEYLFGKINGFTPGLLRGVLAYVGSHPEIETVITYNDTGTYELTAMRKYYRRLYVDPMFEASNIKKMNAFKGYYMVVDFPRINPQSIYAHYFNTCKAVYHDASRRINADVYDCRGAEDIE